jgi:ribosome biogenesis protein Tsr3
LIRDYVQEQHDRILEEFIEKYFYCKNEQKIDINEERDAFEQLLINSCETDQDELETVVRAIAKRYNQYRVPYIVLLNEVNYFRNAISNVLLEHEA